VIDFPSNPTVGQAFTHEGTIYTCVLAAPVVWNASPAAAAIPDAPVDQWTYGRSSAAWVVLTKDRVGLDNVDNTSDAAKPISTATATALAGKEPTIVAGTAAQYRRGDKTWQPLNKAAVGLSNVDNTQDAAKTVAKAGTLGSGGIGGAAMTFTWAGQTGAPGWLWGGNDGTNMAVYSPNNITVGNSSAVSGISGWNYSNRAKNPAYVWATDGATTDQYLTQPGNLRVSWANTVGSVEGAGGGTIQGGVAINGTLWTNATIEANGGAINVTNGNVNINAIPGGLNLYNYRTNGSQYGVWAILANPNYSQMTIEAQHFGGNYVTWRLYVNGHSFDHRNDGWGEAPSGWRQGSDRRLKSDIQPITDALTKLSSVHGYTFFKKGLKTIDGEPIRTAGMIAQEVQEVLPEAVAVSGALVDDEQNVMLTLDTTGVVAIAVNAINELKSQLDAALARIETLEGMIVP
jgi:hypothetical protein